MLFVWRMRRRSLSDVLWYCSCVVSSQSYTHSYEQFLMMNWVCCWFWLRFVCLRVVTSVQFLCVLHVCTLGCCEWDCQYSQSPGDSCLNWYALCLDGHLNLLTKSDLLSLSDSAAAHLWRLLSVCLLHYLSHQSVNQSMSLIQTTKIHRKATEHIYQRTFFIDTIIKKQ